MDTRGLLVPSGLLLAGCIENWLHTEPEPPEEGKPPLHDSASTPVDSAVDDTQPPPCDETWEDGVADLVESCPAAAQDIGRFVTVWRGSNGGQPFWDLGTLRRQDTNEDGSIGSGDAMQLVLETHSDHPDASTALALVDQDGTLLGLSLEDKWRSAATAFEQDASALGQEIFASSYAWGDTVSTLTRLDAMQPTWSVSFGAQDGQAWNPWPTDLEGDGSAEILLGQRVFRASDGSVAFELEDVHDRAVVEIVAADLDLDGVQEIIVATDSTTGVRIHEAGGSLRASCMTDSQNAHHTTLAIGDMYGDDRGEIVVAESGRVFVCDAEGAVVAQVAYDSTEPCMVGIAQLDDDAAAEIVVADYQRITALDNDLSTLWTHREPPDDSSWLWHPFTLVDLDRDGRHEVLTNVSSFLLVLSPDGVGRARHATVHSASWHAPPLLADIDADGLAEIVVTGLEGVELIENDVGGWLIPGSDRPHPAYHHYPGDRSPTGALPDPDHHPWTSPATNVCQGEERVISFPDHTELSVDIVDVCVIDCDGDAVVTAYLSNHGVKSIEQTISVTLAQLDTDSIIASGEINGLASQEAKVIQLEVPSEDLEGGVLMTAGVEDPSDECGTRANEDRWEEPVCP